MIEIRRDGRRLLTNNIEEIIREIVVFKDLGAIDEIMILKKVKR